MREDDKTLRISKKTLFAIYDCFDAEKENDENLYGEENDSTYKEFAGTSGLGVSTDKDLDAYIYHVMKATEKRNKKELEERVKSWNEKIERLQKEQDEREDKKKAESNKKKKSCFLF